MQIIFEIITMAWAKVNRELAILGVDLTSTYMSKGYITCSKSKASSVMHEVEENNVLPSETLISDDNEEALAGAATTLNLLSPPTDNSTSQNLCQSPVKMKCYYHNTHYCFLDYFHDPVISYTIPHWWTKNFFAEFIMTLLYPPPNLITLQSYLYDKHSHL